MAEAVLVKCDAERIEQWRAAAKSRGLPLATWLRRVANEECERQAALLLYQIRHERPHELNAIVEEVLKQRAERDDPEHRRVAGKARGVLLDTCRIKGSHRKGKRCESCGQIPD